MVPHGRVSEKQGQAVQEILFAESGDERGPQAWRPIHYLGSKLRLIDSIGEILDELDPSGGGVCDLFAGSGTVSLALSRSRNVVAADIQEYARVICSALLGPLGEFGDCEALVDGVVAKARKIGGELNPCVRPLVELETRAIESANLDPDLLCSIVEDGSLIAGSSTDICSELAGAKQEAKRRIAESNASSKLVATRYFGGLYFAYEQAFWIDCFSEAVATLPEDLQNVGLASVLSTASSVVNTVGKQFAQPMRPRRKNGSVKTHLVQQMCRDRKIAIEPTFIDWIEKYLEIPRVGCHRVVRADYREVLEKHCKDVSAIYADPPYTRDHYSRFYHVLETLCLRDSPTVSSRFLNGSGPTSRGVYRQDRHQSPFCIKSQAAEAFVAMFRGAEKLKIPMLLSYSPYVRNGHPRLMPVDGIIEIASNFFSEVRVTRANGVTHSKLNRAELEMDVPENAEILVACR